jgi:NAD(P)-dependent dehydrogenase (short-subunit alcohol dehydrogenase family)
MSKTSRHRPEARRVAVVSGGNRGIGLEVVRQLAELSCDVVLGARDPKKGEAARRRLGAPSAVVMPLDVADPAAAPRLADAVRQQFGRCDILINNAAVHYDTWETATRADFKIVYEVLETNVVGAWRLAAALVPLMRQGRYGRIVNVSSEAGSLASMGAAAPAYAVSKAALNALTRVLAAELRGTGILVNAVCPGWVATDMGGRGGRPVEQGAAGIVWAATLADDGPTGGFFRDGAPLPW